MRERERPPPPVATRCARMMPRALDASPGGWRDQSQGDFVEDEHITLRHAELAMSLEDPNLTLHLNEVDKTRTTARVGKIEVRGQGSEQSQRPCGGSTRSPASTYESLQLGLDLQRIFRVPCRCPGRGARCFRWASPVRRSRGKDRFKCGSKSLDPGRQGSPVVF